MQTLIVQPIFGQPTDLVVLHQHIALGGQRTHQLLALGCCNVDGHRLLAAVGRQEVGGVGVVTRDGIAYEGRAHFARVVTAIGVLDLDDFSPQVGEVLSGPGSSQNAREVKHAHTCQRRCRGCGLRCTHQMLMALAIKVRWICEVPPPMVDCMPSRK